ncbi:ankyrin repeat domain-containing protein 49-like [Bacillus rossius redtenbacheri]|uniref:ankyrin repeat domain-containing protein 49-like n=1 Tax=Bacillus rossius redtenbacheri TaxID=93214 RepID=UPI002FDC8A97
MSSGEEDEYGKFSKEMLQLQEAMKSSGYSFGQVSGWDDDTQEIDDDSNPKSGPEREILRAAETGNLGVVQRLLETDLQLMHVRDKDGYTPLHRACYNDHIDVVNHLLLKGANIRAETEDGWQPLHSSCMWNNYRCVAKLLDHGADINATSKGGQTPLHLAASNGQAKETLQLLLMNPYIRVEARNASNETASNIAMRSNKHYRLFEMVEPCLSTL